MGLQTMSSGTSHIVGGRLIQKTGTAPAKAHKACQTPVVGLPPDINLTREFEYHKSIFQGQHSKISKAKLMHNGTLFSLWNVVMQKFKILQL